MSTSDCFLGDFIFGQTRGRILSLLFGHASQSYYLRQIAREIGVSAGAVQRELESLSKFALVERTDSGHQVYFRANRAHPIFAELNALVSKTVGVFYQLRSALTPLANRISLAFVYGSMARQDENAGSDVDLMVVGDVTFDEILPLLAPVERAIGRSINPTLYSMKEFKLRQQSGNHFLTSVLRGATVPLIGDMNEFGKVG
jgi:predicted nucleotidyltransferase